MTTALSPLRTRSIVMMVRTENRKCTLQQFSLPVWSGLLWTDRFMRKQLLLPACIAILAAAIQVLPAAERIVGGPFAVNVSGRTATVVWLVQANEVTLKAAAGANAVASPALRVE